MDTLIRQRAGTAHFEEMLWNKPENKHHAGKLLIIGGNTHEFASVQTAYTSAALAGIGVSKVLLPDGLKPTIGAVLDNAEFAPTNASGSFARDALAEWLDWAAWADGVLLCGDLGRNSETAIVFESFLKTYTGQLTITKDAIEYAANIGPGVVARTNTTLVLSVAQLQKLGIVTRQTTAVRFSMTLLQLADALHAISQNCKANIITKHHDTIFVACDGKVSMTQHASAGESWRVDTAACASVWWLQNPAKPFEALTTAVV